MANKNTKLQEIHLRYHKDDPLMQQVEKLLQYRSLYPVNKMMIAALKLGSEILLKQLENETLQVLSNLISKADVNGGASVQDDFQVLRNKMFSTAVSVPVSNEPTLKPPSPAATAPESSVPAMELPTKQTLDVQPVVANAIKDTANPAAARPEVIEKPPIEIFKLRPASERGVIPREVMLATRADSDEILARRMAAPSAVSPPEKSDEIKPKTAVKHSAATMSHFAQYGADPVGND